MTDKQSDYALDVFEAVKVYGTLPGGVRALDKVSIQVINNEFFTLLGPSGCGKTTLLRMIAGFEEPTSGRISLHGANTESLPAHKRRVNTVFQSYALFPHMTIAQNIAFGLENLRWDKQRIKQRVVSGCACRVSLRPVHLLRRSWSTRSGRNYFSSRPFSHDSFLRMPQ